MFRAYSASIALALGSVSFAVGCAPTDARVTPIVPPGSSSGAASTGGLPSGGLCAACNIDLDCGEAGSALCVGETVLPGGHCATVCVTDADCGPSASCMSTNSSFKTCYPTSQTCQGYDPGSTGGETATSGATTTGGSSSASTTAGASTTGGSSAASTTAGATTGGTSGNSCPGYAEPNTPAGCTCSSGQSCAANKCYGGWYCQLSNDKCVAPPASCEGNSSTTGGTTAGATTTGATTSTSTSTTGGTTTSGVGPHGGSVSLLHFGISGDTRPPNCEDTSGYPTVVINSIGDAYKAANVQFSLDLGDHMYVCNNDASIANAQMNLFMQGVSHFGGTWFMTEGNHECMGSGSGSCPAGSTNVNYVAFMNALSPISSSPYYSVNVQTSNGLATFVFIADNSWNSTQETWLEQTLTQADQNAKYTLIAKHHPEGDSSISSNSQIMTTIRRHKFALLLTGHTHTYEHQTTDSGRDLVLGNGGAPLVSSGTFNGYGIVDQKSNGQLQVTIYDLASGAPHDQWSVGPN